jgi:hypothetical protein
VVYVALQWLAEVCVDSDMDHAERQLAVKGLTVSKRPGLVVSYEFKDGDCSRSSCSPLAFRCTMEGLLR